MTTILADAKLGVIVSDSNASDTHMTWKTRKVFRVHGALIGMAGNLEEFEVFLDWAKSRFQDPAPKIPSLHALVLSRAGLLHYQMGPLPIKVDGGRMAIGTGAMAAMAAYDALHFREPAHAVRIACRHDANSRGPVRTYHL